MSNFLEGMQWNRLLYMFSFYNMIVAYTCFVFQHVIPAKILDIVRATSMYVVFAVIFYYIGFGIDSIRIFYSELLGQPQMHVIRSILLDIFFHIIPAILLGFPQRLESCLYGFIIIFVWLIVIRTKAEKIYGTESNKNHLTKIMLLYRYFDEKLVLSLLYPR
jgi:hypothetical protein